MKNLKKVLSLILVVAMACSMMVFASAKDYKSFPDADKISDQYTEAVDVIAALGIFAGDDEGYLNPQGTFTRAQAAKIVTYLSIGATAAERLSATGGVFKDVPATHWASKYIAYAYNAGILSGDGDGNYRPNDAVKGSEVAKMMNTVLGYGKTGEYSGASWELNAISHGVSRGLITGSADLTAPAKREEVIQYVFNTIDPRGLYNYYVEYSSIIGAYVEAAGSNWAVGQTNKTNIGAYVFNLSAIGDDDASGRPTHYWKSGATILTGEYVSRAPAYTSTGGSNIYTDNAAVKAYDLESAHKLTFASDLTIYRNGLDYSASGSTALSKLGDPYVTGTPNNTASKLGVITELYTDENGDVDLIVIIEKQIAQIVSAPKYSYGAVSSIAGINGYTSAGGYTFAGDMDLVEDDIVLYYADAASVVHVEKAKAIEGQLTSFTDSVYGNAFVAFVFSGTTHAVSGLTGLQAELTYGSPRASDILTARANYNVDSTIYVDDHNSIVWFVPGQGITNYAYLYDTGIDGFNAITQGRLLLTDGTYLTASIKAAAGYSFASGTGNVQIAKGAWYSYSESNGTYTLKPILSSASVATSQIATATTVTGTPTVANQPAFLTNNGTTYYGNGSTIFVILDSTFYSSGNVKVVTGVANLPSSLNPLVLYNANSDKFAIINDTTGYAKYVLIDTRSTAAGASNVIFFGNPGSYTETGSDYVTYASAVVNGEVLSNVKVASTSVKSVRGLYNVTLSGDVYTVGNPVTNSYFGSALVTGTNALRDNTRNTAYNVSSTAKIYEVEVDNYTYATEVSSLGRITTTNKEATDAGRTQYYDYWYVANSAGTITELYFVKSATATQSAAANAAAATLETQAPWTAGGAHSVAALNGTDANLKTQIQALFTAGVVTAYGVDSITINSVTGITATTATVTGVATSGGYSKSFTVNVTIANSVTYAATQAVDAAKTAIGATVAGAAGTTDAYSAATAAAFISALQTTQLAQANVTLGVTVTATDAAASTVTVTIVITAIADTTITQTITGFTVTGVTIS